MSVSKWCLVKRTLSVWWSHHATRLAAAVSFYALLAIAPLMVVALNALSWIYGGNAEQRIGQQVETFVGTGGTATPRDAIQQILAIVARSKHGNLAVVVSFVVALVSGSSLFSSVQDAINTLWDIQPPRHAPFLAAVRDRIVAGAMLFVVAVLLLASLVLSAALAFVTRNSVGRIVGATYIGDTLLSFALVTLLFAMIYKFLPRAKILWSDVWLGAMITAGLFIAGRSGLAVYFWFASMRNPYGAAGSIAALLLWIYYSSMLVFFGAAFTRVYAESRGKPITADD